MEDIEITRFESVVSKKLYVLQARKVELSQDRKLGAEDYLAGWELRDGTPINEGHERGLLHDLHARHVLSWAVSPGDTVLATLNVELRGTTVVYQSDTGSYPITSFNRARTERRIWSLAYEEIEIACETTLARSVMLGEDDADGAFGRDAIAEQLLAALADDWRISFCTFRPRVVPEDEPELTGDRLWIKASHRPFTPTPQVFPED